jgi:mRNA interferase HigB
MEHWIEVVSEADWSNVQDVRQTFNHVDYVGNDRFVFNLRGNHYRIVAMIFFKVRTLFIRFVGTHQEYDKIEDITLI